MRPTAGSAEDDPSPLEDREGDEEGIGNDEGALLPDAGDDAPEFEDELPTDPSFDIDLPSGLDADDSEATGHLPVGPEFAPREEDDGADDALGFADKTSADALSSEVGNGIELDASDGFEDGHALLDGHELPRLDGDDGPELEDSRLGPALEFGLEVPLAPAAAPWRVELVVPDREHCGALAVSGGVVVAGSNDLFWLDPGRETPVRIALDGTRISSIALVGGMGAALCVTAFGRLLRRARSGGDVERLLDWRRVAEAAGASAEGLELRGLGGERPNSVLGRLTSGRLVRSDDMGSTFQLVTPEVTALAMSSAGEPVTVLSRDGARLSRSFDGGVHFEHRELDSPARDVALGEAPLLAADAEVVALGDAERGLVVSADGARTFRRIAGTNNVTACAVGQFAGRPTAFATVYRETHDETVFVRIDAETAEASVIATLSSPSSGDTELEVGRVERLSWDGERLWAAGAFGLAVVRMR
jgi:hypothetical protein